MAFRLALGIGALGIVFVLIMAVSWVGLVRKASIYDRLAEENQTLLQEHKRIAQLQSRVERLQQLEDQIRRVLGADALPDTGGRFSIPSYASRIGQPQEAEEQTYVSPARRSAESGIHNFVQFSQDPAILIEPEIPSLWPAQGFVSRGFETNDVVPSHAHWGIDIAAQEGTVIKATAGGMVIWAGWSPLYGNVAVLAHASEYYSVYGHNQIILVKPRDRVKRGDPIALLGNTGQSSAPHLHFEIWHGNEPLDPADLLMPL